MLRLLLLLAAAGAHAHGDHGHNGLLERADDESLSYAERHVRIAGSVGGSSVADQRHGSSERDTSGLPAWIKSVHAGDAFRSF